MSITLSTKTYNSDRITPDSITYAGPANTLSITDTVELKRVYPKAGTGVIKGVARPNVRIARSVVVDAVTGEKQLLVFNGSFSVPVGTSDTDLGLLQADIVDFFQLEEANTTALVKKLDISY